MVLYGPRRLSGPPCYWRPGILIGGSSSKKRVGQGWQGEGKKKSEPQLPQRQELGDFRISNLRSLRLPELPARKGRTSRACRLEAFTLPVNQLIQHDSAVGADLELKSLGMHKPNTSCEKDLKGWSSESAACGTKWLDASYRLGHQIRSSTKSDRYPSITNSNHGCSKSFTPIQTMYIIVHLH